VAATTDEAHVLDELTGVLKPSRVGSALQKFVARFRRDEMPISIVVCDVAGLDQYNNHYGRPAGDAILQLTARMLMAHCRETDLIGRTGEDEFVICMPCRPAKALLAARRMTAEIKKATLEHGGNRLRFTACMGVAGFPEHGGSPVLLYDRARLALDNAKTRGRSVCEEYEKKTKLHPQAQAAAVDTF
jgi:diguanylate cyclase (GGDEF)-like protein